MYFLNGYFGGMHLVWWILWLALLIWIFFVPFGKPEKENPLNILKERFSKGEITKEEYEEHKKVLKTDQ